MINVNFSPSFKRAFKKLIKGNRNLKEKFWQKVEIFTNNPFDSSLKTHKLSGNLKDLWSFSIEYNVRIIFYFEDNQKVVFIDIGSHDQVY
jgi:addiction module RelE/StbE family toxin